MISPLRYPGGKARLFPFFGEVIKANDLYGCTYSEPYCGGAGLALKLLAYGFVDKVELNDIDSAICAFWLSVLNDSDEFCKRIHDTPVTVDEWIKQKSVYRSGSSADQISLGFSAYYLNRTSRSGIIEGSGPIGGYAQKGKWLVDARLNKPVQIGNIRALAEFSSSIQVTNLDAEAFIATRLGSLNRLTYLDPPYYVKGKKLYKNFYRHDDHKRIADILLANRGGNWIVSYDDTVEVRAIYGALEPTVYELPYSAGPVGSGREVVFSSDVLAVPEFAGFRRAA